MCCISCVIVLILAYTVWRGIEEFTHTLGVFLLEKAAEMMQRKHAYYMLTFNSLFRFCVSLAALYQLVNFLEKIFKSIVNNAVL